MDEMMRGQQRIGGGIRARDLVEVEPARAQVGADERLALPAGLSHARQQLRLTLLLEGECDVAELDA